MIEGIWRVVIGDIPDSPDLPLLRLEGGSAQWLGGAGRPVGTCTRDGEQVRIEFPGETGDSGETYYETFAMRLAGDRLTGDCYWGFEPVPEGVGNGDEPPEDIFCDPVVMIRDERTA